MRCFRIFFGLCTLFVIGMLAQRVNAQDDPNFESGIKPYGSYHGGAIDAIDLSNGSLAVNIPLLSYPQRGGKLNLDFVLHYENRGSYLDQECYAIDDLDTICWLDGSLWGHGFNIIQKGAPNGASIVTETDLLYGGVVNQFVAAIQMSDGPSYDLSILSRDTGSYDSDWESWNGTGYHLRIGLGSSPGTGVITGPDGTRYQGADSIPGPTRLPSSYVLSDLPTVPTSIEDTNGNEITHSTSTGWTDTVGRTIPNPTSTSTSGCPSGPQTPTSAWIWHLPGVTGVNDGDYPILFCSITMTETAQADTGYDVPADYSYSATELQSVVLPNGTAWTFQYDMTGPGDLTQITFPTGGTLSYTWTTPDLTGDFCTR